MRCVELPATALPAAMTYDSLLAKHLTRLALAPSGANPTTAHCGFLECLEWGAQPLFALHAIICKSRNEPESFASLLGKLLLNRIRAQPAERTGKTSLRSGGRRAKTRLHEATLHNTHVADMHDGHQCERRAARFVPREPGRTRSASR